MANRKKTTAEVKGLEFARMSEIGELNGVRYSTIKYYSELGLLPFTQKGKRLAKYYPVKETSQRLKEIIRLKERGKAIPEIINHFIK